MPPPTLNSEEPEKGIYVMCALAFVRLARSGSYDVVTLASRDTDLAPALGEAHKLQAAKIEAAKWYDPSDRRTFGTYKNRSAALDDLHEPRSFHGFARPSKLRVGPFPPQGHRTRILHENARLRGC